MFEGLKKKLQPASVPIFNGEATLLDEDMWPEKPAPRRRAKRKKVVPALNELLAYLSQHEGEVVRDGDVAKALGYRNQSSVNRLLRILREKKAITRKGKRGSFIYTVKRTSVRRQRKARTSKAGTTRVKKVEQVEAPKLNKGQARMLRFISQHQYKFMSQSEIGRSLGISQGSVWRHIKSLVALGLIERSGETVEGTKYRVVGETATARTADGVQTQAAAPADTGSSGSSNEKAFLNAVDELIWEFVRSTRSTDLLLFLTWLERKVK